LNKKSLDVSLVSDKDYDYNIYYFFCSCCKSNKQWIRRWLIDLPFFNHIRSNVNDQILFLYNAFNHGNLTNDIVNSNKIN